MEKYFRIHMRRFFCKISLEETFIYNNLKLILNNLTYSLILNFLTFWVELIPDQYEEKAGANLVTHS